MLATASERFVCLDWPVETSLPSFKDCKTGTVCNCFSGDGLCWQISLSGFDKELVIQRVPWTGDVSTCCCACVVKHIVSNERLGHAELNIGLEIQIITRINLRKLRLEAMLVDHEVDMGGAHIVASL